MKTPKEVIQAITESRRIVCDMCGREVEQSGDMMIGMGGDLPDGWCLYVEYGGKAEAKHFCSRHCLRRYLPDSR